MAKRPARAAPMTRNRLSPNAGSPRSSADSVSGRSSLRCGCCCTTSTAGARPRPSRPMTNACLPICGKAPSAWKDGSRHLRPSWTPRRPDGGDGRNDHRRRPQFPIGQSASALSRPGCGRDLRSLRRDWPTILASRSGRCAYGRGVDADDLHALVRSFLYLTAARSSYLADRTAAPVSKSRDEEEFWRSVSGRPEQTFSALRYRFRTLEERLAGLERHVTSDEFKLNRAFRDIE